MKLWVLGLAFSIIFFTACGRSGTTEQPAEETPAVKTESQSSQTRKQLEPQKSGKVIGKVVFVGKPPAPKKLVLNKDSEVCGKEKSSEELVVGPENGVRWAVVSLYVKPVVTAASPALAVLDQRGCQFQPHVLIVKAGGTVRILNPDGVLHNFRTYSAVNPTVNKAQPKFRKEMDVTFHAPEIFRIGCDAHSWMSGWIVVTDYPFYAVTDGKGDFIILDGVPAGKQIIKVWHETLGELIEEVDVKPDGVTKVTLEMELKK